MPRVFENVSTFRSVALIEPRFSVTTEFSVSRRILAFSAVPLAVWMTLPRPPVSAVIAGRRAAFTRTAGVVARWLVTSRIALEVVKSLPDCRPEVEGAKAQGRTVRVRSVPRKLDDDWAGKVRGDDWKRSDLQAKYAGFFSLYLQRRIDAQKA